MFLFLPPITCWTFSIYSGSLLAGVDTALSTETSDEETGIRVAGWHGKLGTLWTFSINSNSLTAGVVTALLSKVTSDGKNSTLFSG